MCEAKFVLVLAEMDNPVLVLHLLNFVLPGETSAFYSNLRLDNVIFVQHEICCCLGSFQIYGTHANPKRSPECIEESALRLRTKSNPFKD